MAATPKTMIDGSTDVDEDVLNLYVRGGKLQVKVNYLVVLFTAATNAVTVYGTADSDGEIVDGDLSWNAGSTLIDIVLSGFSTLPVGLVTIFSNGSTNVEKVQVKATSSTAAELRFMSSATPGAAVDPDGDMHVNLLFIGA
jgi:hypothetical protein